MQWTPQQVSDLKILWSQGKTAGQIAKFLGEFSRNAVIGKAHRLGLSGRLSPIRKKPRSTPTIHTLTESMCRWPIGDPRDKETFHFCGRLPYARFPYCSEHVRAAYNTRKDTRKPAEEEPDS